MYDELIYKLEELVCDRIKDTDDAMLVCDAINAINALSEPRWIPVTERLPEVNTYVIGCFKDGSMTAVCLFDIDEHMTFWRACTDEGWEADCDSEPTHWMPLPQPPKEW